MHMVPNGDAHSLHMCRGAQARRHLTSSQLEESGELQGIGEDIRPERCETVCPHKSEPMSESAMPGLRSAVQHGGAVVVGPLSMRNTVRTLVFRALMSMRL